MAGPGAADAFHAAYLAFCFLPLSVLCVSPTDHNKQPQSRARQKLKQREQIICARIKKEDEPVWVAPPHSPLPSASTSFLCPLKAAFDSEQTRIDREREREREAGSLPGDTNND